MKIRDCPLARGFRRPAAAGPRVERAFLLGAAPGEIARGTGPLIVLMCSDVFATITDSGGCYRVNDLFESVFVVIDYPLLPECFKIVAVYM